jgi:hypothetical protein
MVTHNKIDDAPYWEVRNTIAHIIKKEPESKAIFNAGANYTNKSCFELKEDLRTYYDVKVLDKEVGNLQELNKNMEEIVELSNNLKEQAKERLIECVKEGDTEDVQFDIAATNYTFALINEQLFTNNA